MHKDEQDIGLIKRVIFGDEESGEQGMKSKIDEVHEILVSFKNVKGFFNGLGGWFKFLLVVGAVIALMKGWLAGLVAYLIDK